MKIRVLMMTLSMYGITASWACTSSRQSETDEALPFEIERIYNNLFLMTTRTGQCIGRIHLKEGYFTSWTFKKVASVLVEEAGNGGVFVKVKAPLYGKLVPVKADEKIYILLFSACIHEEDFFFKVEASAFLDLDEWGVYRGSQLMSDDDERECIAARYLAIYFP